MVSDRSRLAGSVRGTDNQGTTLPKPDEKVSKTIYRKTFVKKQELTLKMFLLVWDQMSVLEIDF